MKRLVSAAAVSLSLLLGGPACLAADAPVATPFFYTVPPGGLSRTIRIMHVASGTPHLAHMGLHKGGEVIRLELAAWPGDRVQVMINGILKEELPVELPAPVLTAPPVPAASQAEPLAAAPASPTLVASLPAVTASDSPAIVPASAAAQAAEPLPASATQAPTPGKPLRIVSGSGVRLRAAPSVSAAEVGKLSLGTLLDELEIGAKEETIGSKSARWYRVALPDGRSGWIFGAFTMPVLSGDRDAALVTLARQRLAPEKQTPAELLELHKLLRSAVANGATPAGKAALEFHALLALNRYLREAAFAGSSGTLPPAAAPYADELDFSEPAGMYMCKYDTFWNLYEKLADSPLADDLAWQAAHQPIPGETEGFFDLMLAQIDRTSGRYLRARPAGAHVPAALKDITDYLFTPPAAEGIQEPEDLPEEELTERLPKESRPDALVALASLRAAVAGTSHPDRDVLLRRLDGFAKRIGNTGE